MESLENKTIKDRYFLLKQIGKGSFGQVYLAVDNNKGDFVAIKCENANSQTPRIPFEASVM